MSDDSPFQIDHTNSLPDECLALIFNYLTTTNDRNNSSLVSHRWFRIDAETRTHLTLKPHSDLQPFIPSIFTRFSSVTQLVLTCNYPFWINDDVLTLIASRYPNLTLLTLHGCRNVTYTGMAVLSQSCRKLKKFSCSKCGFGPKGIIVLLNACSSLEELSVKNLSAIDLFEPLVIGSSNLKTLKVCRWFADWERYLDLITASCNSLVEVHLEHVVIGDVSRLALSKCSNLQVLHLDGLGYCTNTPLVSEHCKYLKKLYINDHEFNTIPDDSLFAIVKYCINLEELVLIGVDVCCSSLEAIVANCRKLERLDLCSSETITDVEISHIAEKCVALKNVLIKDCCVSDKGVEAFALGCPNLVEIRLAECEFVTREVEDRLRAIRGSLVVKLDAI